MRGESSRTPPTRAGFLETFLLDSWLEHLRQHKRVTNADRALQSHVLRFLKAETIVTHLIAAESASDIKA
jgi:hypothetical protein